MPLPFIPHTSVMLRVIKELFSTCTYQCTCNIKTYLQSVDSCIPLILSTHDYGVCTSTIKRSCLHCSPHLVIRTQGFEWSPALQLQKQGKLPTQQRKMSRTRSMHQCMVYKAYIMLYYMPTPNNKIMTYYMAAAGWISKLVVTTTPRALDTDLKGAAQIF